jgi:heme-degrading monooxygenase HmoA
MFTRIVSMQLKPNTHTEFTEKFEKEIMPRLKKQQGFQDELLCVVPGAPEVVAISLWDSKESAETYNRTTYPEVLKTLANLVEPTPMVRTYEVAYSTFQKIAARVAA